MVYQIIRGENGQYGLEGKGIRIEDAFSSEREAAFVVDRLNRGDASPIHIYEMIEDYFGRLDLQQA